MDTKTADAKSNPTAVKPRVRIMVAGKNPTDIANPGEHAVAESLDTVGNHFLQTMERIRQKNREVAAARGITRTLLSNKPVGSLPEVR